jgi:copper(I)-binding protein
MRTPRAWPFAVLLSLLLVALAACSTGGGAADPTISDAWVRPPMGADRPAAAYLTIVGGDEADALVSASSPVAGEVQVHETMAGMSGMAGMQEVEQIEVGAGATVRLEPGGYHLMLMEPDTAQIVVGETVEITLTFEQAGDITIEAEVRAG